MPVQGEGSGDALREAPELSPRYSEVVYGPELRTGGLGSRELVTEVRTFPAAEPNPEFEKLDADFKRMFDEVAGPALIDPPTEPNLHDHLKRMAAVLNGVSIDDLELAKINAYVEAVETGRSFIKFTPPPMIKALRVSRWPATGEVRFTLAENFFPCGTLIWGVESEVPADTVLMSAGELREWA